jgi:pantetheine-phosphate adenylyltransferase
MLIAIYAASLDPITRGHLEVIRRSARLFGTTIVAVGENPDKRPTFSTNRRVSLAALSLLEANVTGNVEVDSYSGEYLVDYARRRGAEVLVRGVRNEADYGYESTMADVSTTVEFPFAIE